MKKIFTLGALALFLMTSCSSDDSSAPVDNGSTSVLLKKTISTDEDGYEYTTNYTYDGNKLTSVTDSENSTMNLFYENDLLVKIEYFEDGTITQRDLFTYNSNNELATYNMLDLDEDWAYKTLFTHNSNGTVSTIEYNGDLTEQTNLSGNGIVTYTNNNITNYTTTSPGGYEVSWTYTFDDKNSPLKNITSFDAFNLAYQEGGHNNILSTINEAYNEASSTTYTYNNDNYPLTSIEIEDDGYTTSTQYFYE